MRWAWLKPMATLFALILIGSGSTLIIFSRVHAIPRLRSIQATPSRPSPQVRLDQMSFASSALLDRSTQTIYGSENMAEPSDTMSMIKAWIAADYLRDRPSLSDRSALD